MSRNIQINEIIGRKTELEILNERMSSKVAEFLAIYGRRRVGKSFIIKKFFGSQQGVLFEQTGINEATLSEQLGIFAECFGKAFYRGATLAIPKNWNEALKQLTAAIDEVPKNRRIIIIFDELPWLASHKSGFLKALQYYWNTNWTYRKKLMLIVCGSAASWMLDNIVYAKGGLHNRITVRIPLKPWTLEEAEAFLISRGFQLNKQQILQIYMVTGGIPHYLQALRKGLSATQNINALCFQRGGILFDEFNILFHSLYDEPETYISLIQAIASKMYGISRDDLIAKTSFTDGGGINRKLRSLEAAGFIASFLPVGHTRRGVYYRICDEYTLFYLRWIKSLHLMKTEDNLQNYWQNLAKKPEWFNWAGYAFEAICFKHIHKIKKALDIEHINSTCSDWRYQPEKSSMTSGTQIDLIFDRDDDCVTLCEIKYSAVPFVITKNYFETLLIKERVFKEKTRCNKQIFWALIASNGAIENQYLKKMSLRVITIDDLF